MLTYTEINAAVQSAKVLYEIIKANKELANYNELSAAASEIYAKLMSATGVALASQEKQAALSDRIRDLEKELMEFKNWERESDRYQLTELCAGVINITIKPGMENNEPPHRLCTACFNKRQKGYLQRTEFNSLGTFYKCDNCGGTLLDHSNIKRYQNFPVDRGGGYF